MQVLVEDDGLKPANAKQIATRFLKTDHAQIFTGTIFTNVALAMLGDVLDSGAYWFGNNTAPNEYGGKDCAPNYFVSGWDETLHASAGILANELGKQRLFLLAPNYQAGKQILAAVKGTFKGQIAGEVYTSLDQTDFSAEIAEIRAANPDAIYEFQPGGLGVNFLKQWAASGLQEKIPLVVGAPSLDPRLLAAVGDAALGMHIAANWNADLDNPANQTFVAAYRAAYSRPPTYYAANSYDTALMIGAALKGVRRQSGRRVSRRHQTRGVRLHPRSFRLCRKSGAGAGLVTSLRSCAATAARWGSRPCAKSATWPAARTASSAR